jgi:hypothetical protein
MKIKSKQIINKTIIKRFMKLLFKCFLLVLVWGLISTYLLHCIYLLKACSITEQSYTKWFLLSTNCLLIEISGSLSILLSIAIIFIVDIIDNFKIKLIQKKYIILSILIILMFILSEQYLFNVFKVYPTSDEMFTLQTSGLWFFFSIYLICMVISLITLFYSFFRISKKDYLNKFYLFDLCIFWVILTFCFLVF